MNPTSNLLEAVAGPLAQEFVEGCAIEPNVLTLGVDEPDEGALPVDAQVLHQDGEQHGGVLLVLVEAQVADAHQGHVCDGLVGL